MVLGRKKIKIKSTIRSDASLTKNSEYEYNKRTCKTKGLAAIKNI